ncbi:hypothetical protein AB1Y20_004909 [Prymnesium parvum]|uniref:CAP-Gly domain-containing protein n=1 Tax=Prymnesium parvum TaxID=97485 RepID=A0AB34IYS1_PRYPA
MSGSERRTVASHRLPSDARRVRHSLSSLLCSAEAQLRKTSAASAAALPPPRPPPQHDAAGGAPPGLWSLGDRVLCGGERGRVAFVGMTMRCRQPGDFVGVELDEAVGEHDGEVDGVRYFTARPRSALFVRAEELVAEAAAACTCSSGTGSSAAAPMPCGGQIAAGAAASCAQAAEPAEALPHTSSERALSSAMLGIPAGEAEAIPSLTETEKVDVVLKLAMAAKEVAVRNALAQAEVEKAAAVRAAVEEARESAEAEKAIAVREAVREGRAEAEAEAAAAAREAREAAEEEKAVAVRAALAQADREKALAVQAALEQAKAEREVAVLEAKNLSLAEKVAAVRRAMVHVLTEASPDKKAAVHAVMEAVYVDSAKLSAIGGSATDT